MSSSASFVAVPLVPVSVPEWRPQPVSRGVWALVVAAHLGLLVAVAAVSHGRLQPIKPPRPLPVMMLRLPAPLPVKAQAPKPKQNPRPSPVVPRSVHVPVVPQPVAAPAAAPPAAPAVSAPAAISPEAPVRAPITVATPVPQALAAPRFDADYLDNPAPTYPSLSRRAREEGKVVLRVWVDPSGAPDKIELHKSSGFERLDQAALRTVAKWKFVPARQGEATVAAWVLVPVEFSLNT